IYLFKSSAFLLPIFEHRCFQFLGTLIAKCSVFLIAKSSALLLTDYTLFGELTFKDGVPVKNNFHQYKMIRQKESPKKAEVHFVKNEEDPAGLGEPLFAPPFAAVASALYKTTGKRYYDQPLAKHIE